MTVGELIDILQDFNDELLVNVSRNEIYVSFNFDGSDLILNIK